MTFADVIEAVAEKAGLLVVRENDDYVKCAFSLEDGRTQTVHVFSVGELSGLEIARISTPVLEFPDGTLPAKVTEGLLLESSKMQIGSFCVENVQGHKILNIQHNMILETLDPEELHVVVGTLALIGDKWENQLGGGDRF